jgi:hypothetical protein
MPIPQITFPIPQEQIRAKHHELSEYLKGLQAEQRIILEMMKAIRSVCQHNNKYNYGCNDCGAIWGD